MKDQRTRNDLKRKKGNSRLIVCVILLYLISRENIFRSLSCQKLSRKVEMKSLLSFCYPLFFSKHFLNRVKLIFVLKWHPIIDFCLPLKSFQGKRDSLLNEIINDSVFRDLSTVESFDGDGCFKAHENPFKICLQKEKFPLSSSFSNKSQLNELISSKRYFFLLESLFFLQ